MPLSQIATMERAEEDPDVAIRVLDAELAATVERLNGTRAAEQLRQTLAELKVVDMHAQVAINSFHDFDFAGSPVGLGALRILRGTRGAASARTSSTARQPVRRSNWSTARTS